jgi:tRNA pseudouridine55 synthase
MQQSGIQGLFLCRKPAGVSSAGFLNSIKRIFKLFEPIGHGGTLDPFAEGLLVVGIGRQYTRALEHYLKGTEKTYEATVILGASSSTYDREGIISHMPGVQAWAPEDIKTAMQELYAREEQVPPPVSAKKIRGVPAYTRFRRGEQFTLQPRPAKLVKYEILGIEEIESLTKLDIRLRVSSGFYIRSFAHDLGVLLGSDGYVERLIRTEIGYLKVEEALTLQDMQGTVELVYRAKGEVQQVGFRAFAKELAEKAGITGHARNMKEGGVEIVGQGTAAQLSQFLAAIKKGPEAAKIQSWQDYFRKCSEKKDGFEIVEAPVANEKTE